MAEWMERSSTERASLTKMNTMLTSGRLSGNERLRHLERTVRLLDVSVTRLGSPQVLDLPRSWFHPWLEGSGIQILPRAASSICFRQP